MDLDDLVDLIRTDLTQIEDALRWAHTDSYWPSNAAPTKTLILAPPPDDRNGDHVPGPRHDFGIGNHRRRQALSDVLGELDKMERLWPISHLAGKTRTLQWALLVIAQNRARLELIDRFGTPNPKATKARVRDLYRCTDRACRRLDAAFAEGKAAGAGDQTTGAAEKTPMCWVCKIRPKQDKTGKRCFTCWAYKQRKKRERPRDLDGMDAARQAKARRVARGEGWGEA